MFHCHNYIFCLPSALFVLTFDLSKDSLEHAFLSVALDTMAPISIVKTPNTSLVRPEIVH